MPVYMTQFAYTPQAWAALAKQPENRAEAFSKLAKELGGRLIDLYYCFGEYDGVVLFEAPDDSTASGMVIAAAVPGHLRSTRTTRLMTVNETVESLRKAGAVAYAPPRGMGEPA